MLKGMLLVTLAASLATVGGSIPSPDRLVPDDTVAFLTAPNFGELRNAWNACSHAQLLKDPSMKPFVDNALSNWTERMVQPLEKKLNLKLAQCKELLQGQVTLALTRSEGPDHDGASPGLILLVDTGNKRDELQRCLTLIKKQAVDSGQVVRTNILKGAEFAVISMSTEEVPATIRRFFPARRSEQPAGGQDQSLDRPRLNRELLFGRVDSALIVGTTRRGVEQVLTRLKEGGAVANVPACEAHRLVMPGETLCFGWIHMKVLLAWAGGKWRASSEAPNPLDIPPQRIFQALGLAGVNSLSLSFHAGAEGSMLQLFIDAPETNRHGLLSLMAGANEDPGVPPFVPANSATFLRWRIDGRKTRATLERMLKDLSPQMSSAVNFILDSANLYTKQSQPNFDIRTHLLGNIGEDVVFYRKVSPPGEPSGVGWSTPALLLLGSPNPEELAGSLKSILIFLSQQASTPPQEREFLGRKIFSVPLGVSAASLGLRSESAKRPTLHYSASSGYVGLSTDSALLEEYLRVCEKQEKALRDLPGIREAVQKVAGTGWSLVGYENQSESMRRRFDALRAPSGWATNYSLGSAAAPLPSPATVIASATGLRDWMDFSLLPSYDKVAKYFSFLVYGGGPTADGLTLKIFAPARSASKP